ncbi:hypothetical protein MGMO_224c00060 [Methyloglobulus morosus KoM1]|uniref:Uncharacterized protein n=1 Tax=Methyloglobulus morosus KoM1 TaxID=1116472 RepID=V5BDU6_9GAMM|nr:hypothetical protein MGMO_224c00060 [Methyloglobulus morosus KoM1]
MKWGIDLILQSFNQRELTACYFIPVIQVFKIFNALIFNTRPKSDIGHHAH